MADLVLGLGTSHTPMLSLEPQYWHLMGEGDKNNPELVSVPDGELCSYDELMERADPNIAKGISLKKFEAKHKAIQKALTTLAQTLEAAAPDVAVIISDDQDELLFEDNMPTYSIFWGDNYPLIYLKERLSTLCPSMALRCDVSLYRCRTLPLGYV